MKKYTILLLSLAGAYLQIESMEHFDERVSAEPDTQPTNLVATRAKVAEQAAAESAKPTASKTKSDQQIRIQYWAKKSDDLFKAGEKLRSTTPGTPEHAQATQEFSDAEQRAKDAKDAMTSPSLNADGIAMNKQRALGDAQRILTEANRKYEDYIRKNNVSSLGKLLGYVDPKNTEEGKALLSKLVEAKVKYQTAAKLFEEALDKSPLKRLFKNVVTYDNADDFLKNLPGGLKAQNGFIPE